MKTTYIKPQDILIILLASLLLAASFATIQSGDLTAGFPGFFVLFFLSLLFLKLAYGWSGGGRMLSVLIGLAFVLRLGVGVALYVGLPAYGHGDADDRAGYVFTDAHNRDNQAWMLATSPQPILDAFSRKYATDQYGGLLAFNSTIYRYLSPDAQRPLMLILFSAFFAAVGVPFLWKAVIQVFGGEVAWASTWIFVSFPESVLLGASAMREPYLLTFSAFTLWGFVQLFHQSERRQSGWIWLGLGLLGMLLVSPAVAIFTLIIFAGWIFFANEQRRISWQVIAAVAVVFVLGLLLLSSSLNRSGQFEAASPLHVVNDWLKSAVKWDAYQLERESGWVQKLFDEMPPWMRLPFVAVYGMLQPVLPATFMKPTVLIWKWIGFLRAAGWYAILPFLILSFVAAAGARSRQTRNLLLWLALLVWAWILLAALRGGGDLFDNPRYRTILFLWQSILAGYTWVWWRETRSVWVWTVILMELVFTVIFTFWYGSRYYHWPGQLPFAGMVALILGLWLLVLGGGWWLNKRRA
ncbi:MAG: hypothetical protein ACM3PS_02015 [Syntrophothermus sp.]